MEEASAIQSPVAELRTYPGTSQVKTGKIAGVCHVTRHTVKRIANELSAEEDGFNGNDRKVSDSFNGNDGTMSHRNNGNNSAQDPTRDDSLPTSASRARSRNETPKTLAEQSLRQYSRRY